MRRGWRLRFGRSSRKGSSMEAYGIDEIIQKFLDCDKRLHEIVKEANTLREQCQGYDHRMTELERIRNNQAEEIERLRSHRPLPSLPSLTSPTPYWTCPLCGSRYGLMDGLREL